MIARDNQLELRPILEEILPHEPRRNLVATCERLDPALGPTSTFFGLDGGDEACAAQAGNICGMPINGRCRERLNRSRAMVVAGAGRNRIEKSGFPVCTNSIHKEKLLLGVAWEFSAELRHLIDPATAQKFQGWLEAHATLINQVVPLVLIVAGVFWIGFLYAWPVLHRAFQSRPLQIIYRPPAHTSMWRNLRDYYIEVRNCTTDRTISGVIVTWDQTPFTRFIDRKLYRECLLSPTSIEPSSSESVLLFSLKDDLDMDESKNDE